MARHWSTYVKVSAAQARALDQMTDDGSDGMDLLMEVANASRSKVQRMDRYTIQRHVDTCFERFGSLS